MDLLHDPDDQHNDQGYDEEPEEQHEQDAEHAASHHAAAHHPAHAPHATAGKSRDEQQDEHRPGENTENNLETVAHNESPSNNLNRFLPYPNIYYLIIIRCTFVCSDRASTLLAGITWPLHQNGLHT